MSAEENVVKTKDFQQEEINKKIDKKRDQRNFKSGHHDELGLI